MALVALQQNKVRFTYIRISGWQIEPWLLGTAGNT